MIREPGGQRRTMARILVVDDDARARRAACALLRELDHEPVLCASAGEAVQRLAEGGPGGMLVEVALAEEDGLALAAQVARAPAPVPVWLTALLPEVARAATERARAEGIPVAGTLVKPLDASTLRVALEGPLGGNRAAPVPPRPLGPMGELFPAGARPVREVTPAAALHLAGRTQASGLLEVVAAGLRPRLGLRAGEVVHVEGVPGLVPDLPAAEGADTLALAMGAAIAQGRDPVGTLETATRALRWDSSWEAPRGSFPLAMPTVRWVLQGLRSRPASGSGAGLVLRAQPPTDSPEARWGLDATSTRLLRAFSEPRPLEAVAAELGNGDSARRGEIVAAALVLRDLGVLLDLSEPAAQPAPSAASAVAAAGPAAPPPGPSGAPFDPRTIELEGALERLRGAHPVDALGLGTRLKLLEEDVAAAFREASKRFHPDVYFDAPPAVRALAESCFAELNRQAEALSRPEGLQDGRRFLQARASGLPYVDERTHNQARLAAHRGETASRARDLPAAAAAYAEAFEKDPTVYGHALLSALLGAQARTLPPADALARVEPLIAAHPRHASRTLETLGQVLKLAGRPEEALARFREAVERDPANHDAQRELRLHERRSASAAPPPEPGLLSRLFGKR
jgi:CheY-like chemotaxis protein